MSKQKPYVFAFLVHPRTIGDIKKRYPLLHKVPSGIVSFLFKYVPPVHVADITGFYSKDGNQIIGKIIAIPMSASEMLKNRPYARLKVLRAIRYAKKLKATHVGLGAYTSVVTDGGVWLEEQSDGVHITNGNALTTLMSFRGFQKVRYAWEEKVGKEKPTIAVIGATGSIGAALTKMIAEVDDFERLIIVGRTQDRIDTLVESFSRYSNTSKIISADLSTAVQEADVLIMATSSTGVIISADMPKMNSLIYDIAQPKNISPDLISKRPDVTVVEGGLVYVPEGCSYGYDFGIPRNTMFSCMAETVLLAHARYDEHFCLGHVTKVHIDTIAAIADQYGFQPASIFLSKQ